jgi:integrase
MHDLPDVWRRWWDAHGERLAQSTRKNYARTEALCADLGARPDAGDVARWCGELARRFAPGTAALHRDQMRAVFSYAHAAGWVKTNPVALAPWRRPPPPEPHPVRDMDRVFPRIVAAMPDARAVALCAVVRYLGIRIEEALGLTREDFRPLGIAILRQRPHPNRWHTTQPKGRGSLRARRVLPWREPLRAFLAPVLAAPDPLVRCISPVRRVRVPFVFPYRWPELEGLRRRLARAAPEHFGPGCAWHTFRHTLAFELADSGTPLERIRDVLGHASIATTERYIGRLHGAVVAADAFAGLD